MRRLEIKHHLAPPDVAAVSELLEVAERADGHKALDDHRWLDMAQGGRESFAGLVAWEPGHGHPVGYAQVTHEESATTHPATWALEYVVDPHHRRPDLGIARTLLDAAMGLVAESGGGHVHMWVP